MPRRGHALSLTAIVALAAGARLWYLDQPLRLDEAVTVLRFADDLRSAITDYSAPNNHVLHSVLVHLSTALAGSEPWAIRLPALVFGVGVIVGLYWWIARAVDPDAGLVAAGLAAGSFYLVQYSTIARGYTMMALAYVVLAEVSRRLVVDGPSRGRWAAWIAVSVLGMATVPVFAYPFACVLGWMVVALARREGQALRRRLVSLAAGTSAVAVLVVGVYLPAASVSGVEALVANDFVQRLPYREAADEWRRLIRSVVGAFSGDGLVALAYPPLVALSLVAPRRFFGRRPHPALGLAAVALVILAQGVAPPTRVFVFLWPLVLGCVGAGFLAYRDRLPESTRARVVPLVAVAVAAVTTVGVVSSGEILRSREGGTFRDGEAVAAALLARVGPADRIVAESHPRPVLEYYLRRAGWDGPHLQRDYANAERLFVVVYHPRPQDLDGVLVRVPRGDFASPTLWERFPETDVYLMKRREG